MLSTSHILKGRGMRALAWATLSYHDGVGLGQTYIASWKASTGAELHDNFHWNMITNLAIGNVDHA